MGDLGELGDVEDAAGRIRDGLAEDALRVRAERLLDFSLARVGVYESEFDAELFEGDREEVEGSPVYLRGRNDVVARVAEVEDCESRGRLPGARQYRGDAAFANLAMSRMQPDGFARRV